LFYSLPQESTTSREFVLYDMCLSSPLFFCSLYCSLSVMSTRSGNKKGPPKHANAVKWDPTRFKTTEVKTKRIQQVVVSGCCARCTGQIQWKIDYGKYKPLKAPGKCVACSQRKVKSAYHTFCKDCAEERGVCAKCGQRLDEGEAVAAPISAQEEARLEAELTRLAKRLPERKRRTFYRKLEERENDAFDVDQVKKEALEELKTLVEHHGKGENDPFDLDLLDDLDLEDDEGEEDGGGSDGNDK